MWAKKKTFSRGGQLVLTALVIPVCYKGKTAAPSHMRDALLVLLVWLAPSCAPWQGAFVRTHVHLPVSTTARARLFLNDAAKRKKDRQTLRAQRRIVRELASALGRLQIRGSMAVEYAECLCDCGVQSADELRTLSKEVLDQCAVRRTHRARLKVAWTSDLEALNNMLRPPDRVMPTVPEVDDLVQAPASPSDPQPETEGGIHEFEIDAALAGSRVDAALATLMQPLSRSYFGSLCGDGLVALDGTPVKKSAKLDEGSHLKVQLRAAPELSVGAEQIPLAVLHEDSQMIAVNKAPGMVVHPAPGHWTGTFVNALMHRLQEEQQEQQQLNPVMELPDAFGDGLRPGVVHRLDRFTSGVLLAAKSLKAQRGLLDAFASRRVWKLYLAVCPGLLSPRSVVDENIGRHPRDRLKMAVRPKGEGREAISVIYRLASDGRLSLAAVLIRTGRTHQIRVHMKHLRTPVLGDPVYGDTNWNRKEAARAERPLLHALQVRLNHPVTRELLCVTAPPPDDVATIGAKLAGVPLGEFLPWLEAQIERQLRYSIDSFEF